MCPQKNKYVFKIFKLKFYALIVHLICDVVLFNMKTVVNYTGSLSIYRYWSLQYELQGICNYFDYYH